jgi:hypothetical protein
MKLGQCNQCGGMVFIANVYHNRCSNDGCPCARRSQPMPHTLVERVQGRTAEMWEDPEVQDTILSAPILLLCGVVLVALWGLTGTL